MSFIQYILQEFQDPWIFLGFAAQFMYFLRFLIQWIASEKHQKVVIPPVFWYISMLGAALLLIYSVKRGDLVFITASILNMVIYLRNIAIVKKGKSLPAE